MFDNFLSWLLLPLGGALGWYLATRVQRKDKSITGGQGVPGISQLLSQEPDHAIAALLDASTDGREPLELQLTIGQLFRKRGQVDRALRIHQSLLDRKQMPAEDRQRTRLALAQDLMEAGFFDRAEEAFNQLAAEGFEPARALQSIVDIHERSRNWEAALEANKRLEAVSGASHRVAAAHYHCEMVERDRKSLEPKALMASLKQALNLHPRCGRAGLMQGAIAEQQGDTEAAIRAYRRVPEQDARLIPEVLPLLWKCSQENGTADAFLRWLDQLQSAHDLGCISVMRADLMEQAGFDPTAFVLQEFQRRPSWPLLQRLGRLPPDTQTPSFRNTVAAMHEGLTAVLASRPRYLCRNCGMEPGLLFWQCPSCMTWEGIAPVDDRLPG